MDDEKKRIFRKNCLVILNKRRGFDIKDKILNKKLLVFIKDFTLPSAYKIYKNGLKYIKTQKRAVNILLYCSFRFEVNARFVISQMRKRAKFKVFLPVCEKYEINDSIIDDMRICDAREPLIKNHFGIFEPFGKKKTAQNSNIDIAIIPVLGVDRDYKRIGFGKGMYDRFFSQVKYMPEIIFISRVKNISNESLASWHDIGSSVYIGFKK